MEEKQTSNLKSNKFKYVVIIASVLMVVLVLVSTSMAYFRKVYEGEKKFVVTVNDLSLILNETSNDISIGNVVPQTDEDGMTNSAYTFSLQNVGSTTYSYTIYLEDNDISEGAVRADDNYIKYCLTNDSLTTQMEPDLVSSLSIDDNGRVLETGKIEGNTTYNYTLRFWVDYDATVVEVAGTSFSVKLNIIVEDSVNFVDSLEDKVDTSTTIDFANISSETNGRGIYKYQEDGTDIYYWRGNVDATTDSGNHVIFGGYCWEMVRTTKTGGIKIIYDGEPVEVDGVKTCPNTGEASQLTSESDFHFGDVNNEIYTGSGAYAGYMYGMPGIVTDENRCIRLDSDGVAENYSVATTEADCTAVGGKWATTAYEAIHANVVNSTIKTAIDTWFSTSSLNTEENLEKIEDTVYCNDRSLDTEYQNGTEGYVTDYGANYRLHDNKTPSLECSQSNDRFTVSEENGNGDLTYPVGLLTADEIALAGGVYYESNSDYYLYTGQNYWTLSPEHFNITPVYDTVYMFSVFSNGELSWDDVVYTLGVRPVVSLAAGTTFVAGGTGTESAPYVVQ